jgi:hypothetical protein
MNGPQRQREKPLALMELWCANSGKYFRYVVFHSWPGMKPVYGRT